MSDFLYYYLVIGIVLSAALSVLHAQETREQLEDVEEPVRSGLILMVMATIVLIWPLTLISEVIAYFIGEDE